MVDAVRSIQGSIILRDIEELTPHPSNPRTHDDAQVALIARSMNEFGFTVPVLLDEDESAALESVKQRITAGIPAQGPALCDSSRRDPCLVRPESPASDD